MTEITIEWDLKRGYLSGSAASLRATVVDVTRYTTDEQSEQREAWRQTFTDDAAGRTAAFAWLNARLAALERA